MKAIGAVWLQVVIWMFTNEHHRYGGKVAARLDRSLTNTCT